MTPHSFRAGRRAQLDTAGALGGHQRGLHALVVKPAQQAIDQGAVHATDGLGHLPGQRWNGQSAA